MIDYSIKRSACAKAWHPLSYVLKGCKISMIEIRKIYNTNEAHIGLRWIIQNSSSYCV